MMASVMPKELIDLVESIPPQDEFLIYDIRGDLSSDDVLAAFSAFNVPYKFKALVFLSSPSYVIDRVIVEGDIIFSGPLFSFLSVPSYVIDRVVVEGDIVFSGPYQTKVVITPIVNI
nr:hypothetical protein BaRGS_008129 [Batillaria attramentaria]